ncbi:MAG: Holliday junction branch migration protein RuvA [Alphaproteobacteria bacterium]|nr:Holliday junction branch migration protein RuvA [Alphaproteobacteria bacterium]
MIVKLKGFIEFGGDEYIDLDVNGVVFRVFISNKSIKKIYPSDSLISVFIYEIIKENERLFFGFLEYEEREIFSDLLCVQGVGGKMALNIMTKMEMNEIIESINTENSKSFLSVSGVGSKLANRIINELKEKIKKKSFGITSNISLVNKDNFNDLVSCLFNLGYSRKVCELTADKVINENKKMNLEQLIPVALKYLSKPKVN